MKGTRAGWVALLLSMGVRVAWAQSGAGAPVGPPTGVSVGNIGPRGSEGVVPRVLLTLEDVDGPREENRAALMGVVHHALPFVTHCYGVALMRNPSVQGILVVRLEVTSAGHVTDAQVVNSYVGDASVEQCVAQAFRRLMFGHASGRAPSEVRVRVRLWRTD